ncbi:MAG: phosphate/phosphite/phosphonate ABC transporter substrate-binding protein [Dehalococcoidia bacterium]
MATPTTTMGRLLACILLLTMAAIAGSCGGDGGGDTKIVIAVQPTSTASELTDDAEEIASFLEDQMDGVDVEIMFPTSYAGVIEALRFGHADAAFMGAWPAALATQEADAEVALAEIREVAIGDEIQEQPYYYSYWVVMPDSPYESLEDLAGADVAFPSQLSTSGYVAPMARMVELGLLEEGAPDPEDYFGEVFFAGGYAQGWAALEEGQVDATIIAGDVPEELYREVLDNTRIIEEQGPVPSHSVVFSNDLEEPVRTELKNALLALGSDENRELMRTFISGIFLRFEETTTDEHLGNLSTYLTLTGLEFSEGNTGAQPDPDPDPEPATTPQPDPDPDPEPGAELTPPDGAAQVLVQLLEWEVDAEVDTASAGQVYFLADNVGAETHELVVVRSDLEPGDLPVVDGKVDEEAVDFRGEIEGFASGSRASGVFDLDPGTYVLFCNIVEVEEDGELESHYEQGMFTSFRVE